MDDSEMTTLQKDPVARHLWDSGYEKGVRDAFEIVDVILSEKAENWKLLDYVAVRISTELEVEVAAS